jgi:hypothetical protein
MLGVALAFSVLSVWLLIMTRQLPPREHVAAVAEPVSLVPTVAPVAGGKGVAARLGPATGSFSALLHQGADKAAASLDEVAYVEERDRFLPVVKEVATFTLNEKYETLREFLAAVMSGRRNVVLESLACSREDISSAELECTVRLARYLPAGRP